MHLERSLSDQRLVIYFCSCRFAFFVGVNFGNRSIRPFAAQESNKGEDARQAVEPEGDEKPSTIRPLLLAHHRISSAARPTFWVQRVPVPVNIASLPRSQLLLIPRREKRKRQGCCREGGDQSHNDKDGKGPLT